jgi:hypothetical protein
MRASFSANPKFMPRRNGLLFLAAWLILPAAPAPASAQIVILHTFTGGTDGASPTGDLLLSGSTICLA